MVLYYIHKYYKLEIFYQAWMFHREATNKAPLCITGMPALQRYSYSQFSLAVSPGMLVLAYWAIGI